MAWKGVYKREKWVKRRKKNIYNLSDALELMCAFIQIFYKAHIIYTVIIHCENTEIRLRYKFHVHKFVTVYTPNIPTF